MNEYTIESLSSKEKRELKELYERSPKRRVRKRAHMVLLSDMGYNLKEIARIVMVSRKTVGTYIHAYGEKGINALYDDDIPGRPPSLDEEEKEQVAKWLEGNPRDEGYDHSNWTMKLLSSHIHQKFGVDLSEERVREIAHDLGFRPLRPRYELVEADPEVKERAREKIEKLAEESAEDEDLILFVEDEMTCKLKPTLRWMWGKRGNQPQIPIRDVHEKRTIFGAGNPLDGQIHYHVGERQTKEEFLSLLKLLHQSYPKGKELIIVVDNARTHKAKKVRKFLKEVGRITLVFLPPYCPDENPIERLWKWIRERVTHNYPFKTMDEMIKAIKDAFTYFAKVREQVVSLLGVV